MKAASPAQQPLSPFVAELFEQAQDRVLRRLGRRERMVEGIAAASFLAVSVPLALLADPERSTSLVLAVVLLAAYAFAARVRFDVGAGYTVPTQPLFIAMLFLLPLPAIPLLVAMAFLLADVPDYARGRTHPERAVLSLGDAWHTLGPVLVLLAAGATEPTWSDWPLYVAALGAQFALDFTTVTLREWLGLGIAPAVQFRERVWLYVMDVLLAPIGLVCAIASQDAPYSFLACVPLVVLLEVFARERTTRLEHTAELSRTYRGTAHLLGDVLEADDAYTGSHSRGVVSLALAVGTAMGLAASGMRNVEFAALLHDVGKISIPNEIINKAGPLDENEWDLMRTHTIEGERMLEQVGGVLGDVGRIVRSCHERWDGTGYPDRLRGEEIPVEARIVCACDAFSAMTTTRSYRKGMSEAFALDELQGCAGSQFDPAVADTLVEVVRGSNSAEAYASAPISSAS